jgi:hypothetical protein
MVCCGGQKKCRWLAPVGCIAQRQSSSQPWRLRLTAAGTALYAAYKPFNTNLCMYTWTKFSIHVRMYLRVLVELVCSLADSCKY